MSETSINKKYYLILKRAIDIIFSFIIMILFFPLFLFITLLVIFETRGFPIFIQERGLTLEKRRIKIYKFRTFKAHNHVSENSGILKKSHLKSLVGPISRFLRKTGMDELPQIFNVLKGDMSFVGVRPLILEDLRKIKELYPELYKMREYMNLRLGITGYWQINKDDNISVEHLINMESKYYEKQGLLFDLGIVFKSILFILTFKHKDSILS